MDFSFSSVVRLKKKWQFDLVFRTGRRETGELVRLFFLEKREGRPLVGVTVGKKVAKAAARTRGRRVLREAFRRLLPWINGGVWVVGSLKESALGASARDVYMDLARLMKRRGLLSPCWTGADWQVDKGEIK